MDECLEYFKAVISSPERVAPWGDWWLLNEELVRRLADFHRYDLLLCEDQISLSAAIRRGVEFDDMVPVSLLIQSSDVRDLDFLNSMVAKSDWTYAEEIAKRIIAKPQPHMRPLAVQIAQHEIERIADRGKRALYLIDSLESS